MVSKFDQQIQRALESIVKNDFDKARFQLGAMETNIKNDIRRTNDTSRWSEVKRVRLIRAGLFNKKVRL